MAYEKQTWVCGETITADKLNHIEEGLENCCGGGSSGNLVFTVEEEQVPCPDGETTTTQYTYSLSWQEIYDALTSGQLVTIPQVESEATRLDFFYMAGVDAGTYYALSSSGDFDRTFPDATSHGYMMPCRPK